MGALAVAAQRIVFFLSNDRKTLSRMCTVNKIFNIEASPELYRKVTISSTFDIRDVDDLEKVAYYDKLVSSCLPQNACYVREFEVVGMINTGSEDNLRSTMIRLERIIMKYTCLRAFTWRPVLTDASLAHFVLEFLPRIPGLETLTLKIHYEEKASSIPPPELKRLRHLILASPSPKILLNLPDTLKQLDRQLLSLCLEDDCGSVTPGILASLSPVSQGLHRFSIGVAYALKYDDIFAFVSNLPRIKCLELYHYPQLTNPKYIPKITTIRHLKITHAYTSSRKYTLNMYKWIKRLVSHSPLDRLEIICDDKVEHPGGPHINCDGLIDHLSNRHFSTLRVLQMKDVFIGTTKLRSLIEKCPNLEVLSVSVRIDSYTQLRSNQLLKSARNVREFHMNIVNLRRGKIHLTEDVAKLVMSASNNSLQILGINDNTWKKSTFLSWENPHPQMCFNLDLITNDVEIVILQYAD